MRVRYTLTREQLAVLAATIDECDMAARRSAKVDRFLFALEYECCELRDFQRMRMDVALRLPRGGSYVRQRIAREVHGDASRKVA